LIIEVENRTARLLQHGLTEAGFVVDACADGLDGLHQATTSSYDAIILDAVLPTFDGWMIVAGLRQRDQQTPVLMLSDLAAVEHRVRGLTLGADDFLVKPFSFDELLARLHSLLRRSHRIEVRSVSVGDLTLDSKHLTASRAGLPTSLTVKEFQLLELLVRHSGEVLSRTFISENVWDMSFDCDSNVIEVTIRRLRKKLDDGHDRKIIQTIRGRGYVAR
jgi:two-component system copper resistance phosphate regulon response regulator CusR